MKKHNYGTISAILFGNCKYLQPVWPGIGLVARRLEIGRRFRGSVRADPCSKFYDSVEEIFGKLNI